MGETVNSTSVRPSGIINLRELLVGCYFNNQRDQEVPNLQDISGKEV